MSEHGSEPANPHDLEGSRHPPVAGDFPLSGPNALATMPQRALGLLVDWLIFQLPVVLALLPYVHRTDSSIELADAPIWIGIAGEAALVLYQVISLSWRGQTLGMVLAGTRLRRYVDGARPKWDQAAIRSLLPAVIGVLFSVLEPLVPLTAFIDSSGLRRAWHDKASGTIVVRAR